MKIQVCSYVYVMNMHVNSGSSEKSTAPMCIVCLCELVSRVQCLVYQRSILGCMIDAEVRKVLFLCSRTMIFLWGRNDSLSEIEPNRIK